MSAAVFSFSTGQQGEFCAEQLSIKAGMSLAHWNGVRTGIMNNCRPKWTNMTYVMSLYSYFPMSQKIILIRD